MNRRRFLTTALTSSAAAAASPAAFGQFLNAPRHGLPGTLKERYAKLDAILEQPVFKRELFKDPVIIQSVELLTRDKQYICRVRSKDGHEGICCLQRAADGSPLPHLHQTHRALLHRQRRPRHRAAHPRLHRSRKQLQSPGPRHLGAHRYHRVRHPRHVRQDGQPLHRPPHQRQDLQPRHLRLSSQRRARHLRRRNHRAPQARRRSLARQGHQVQTRRPHVTP